MMEPQKRTSICGLCAELMNTPILGVEMLVLGLRQGLQKPNKNLGGRHAPLTEIFLEHRFLAVESDMKGECFLPQRMKKLSH